MEELFVKNDGKLVVPELWEPDGLDVCGDELAVMLDKREVAGAEEGITGLVLPPVDGASVLAVKFDELIVEVVKGEDVSVDIVELSGLEEDKAAASEGELDEPATVRADDEERTGEVTRVEVEIDVVDTVAADDGVADTNVELAGDVVAASERVVEEELEVDVEVELGEVVADGGGELVWSLTAEEPAFAGDAWIEMTLDVVAAIEDVGIVEDASAVEEVNSHVGVTGMTVNPPSSPASPPSFRRAVGAPETIGALDDTTLVTIAPLDDTASWPGPSERAIGPAEHDQARVKSAAK